MPRPEISGGSISQNAQAKHPNVSAGAIGGANSFHNESSAVQITRKVLMGSATTASLLLLTACDMMGSAYAGPSTPQAGIPTPRGYGEGTPNSQETAQERQTLSNATTWLEEGSKGFTLGEANAFTTPDGKVIPPGTISIKTAYSFKSYTVNNAVYFGHLPTKNGGKAYLFGVNEKDGKGNPVILLVEPSHPGDPTNSQNELTTIVSDGSYISGQSTSGGGHWIHPSELAEILDSSVSPMGVNLTFQVNQVPDDLTASNPALQKYADEINNYNGLLNNDDQKTQLAINALISGAPNAAIIDSPSQLPSNGILPSDTGIRPSPVGVAANAKADSLPTYPAK